MKILAENKRVLVVDDTQSILDDYQKTLSPDSSDSSASVSRDLLFGAEQSVQKKEEECHFDLTFCSQGEEAVDAVSRSLEQELPFAMVFMDSRMPPGMDGVETMEALWALDSELQIVFCTAFSDYDYDHLKRRFGLTDSLIILKKPFEVIEVQQLAVSQTKKWNMLAQIKDAERKNLFLKNYLKNIVDFMPCLLIGINRQTRITHWNKQAEIEIGVCAENAMYQLFSDICPELSAILSDVEKTFETKRPTKISRFPCQTGTDTRYKDITIYPHHLAGIPDSSILIINDVTELWLKDLQLQQNRKMEMIGTLTGGLAHDFNNFLGTICGGIELTQMALRNHTLTDESLSQNLDLCMTATDRAIGMVKQLLNLSRRECPNSVPVNLNGALRRFEKAFELSLDSSITFRLDLPEVDAYVSVDPIHLDQILMNLCLNASHAMTSMREEGVPSEGLLLIRLSPFTVDSSVCEMHPDATLGECWMIEVKDTGVGMSQEILDNLFIPFFTTKGRGMGAGMGLPMVRNMIQINHGFLDVYSRPGKGSTFRVCFPVLTNSVGDDALIEEADPDPIKGAGVILVVDDDESIRNVAGRMLTTSGYEVLYAENGQEAVHVFREKWETIRAVLLDLAMPVLSGDEAFFQMREIDPNAKVLLCSGGSIDPRIEAMQERGLNGFLPKPFSLTDLLTQIESIV